MILQNLTKAIREQNYYAVVLEFLIVIAGVVIGFQITAWNADRSEHELERIYLDRLEDDLREDVNRIDWLLGIYQTKQTVLIELRDGVPSSLMSGDPEEAARNLEYTLWKGVSGPRRAIYDELLGSGNLSLLQDAELRNALADYYSQYTRTSEILEEPIGNYRLLFTQSIPGEIPIENMEQAGEVTIDLIINGLELLQAEPGFKEAVNSEIYYGRDIANWLVIHRQQATDILTMLGGGETL